MFAESRGTRAAPGGPPAVPPTELPPTGAEAVITAAKQMSLPLPDEKRGPLIGRVMSESQEMRWHNEMVPCWVIEYRRDNELQVRTWLRVSDGKVLKQEAFAKGESLSIVREE